MSKPIRKQDRSVVRLAVGVSMISVSALLILLVALGNVLGPVGIALKHFFLGAFGLSFYAFTAAAIVFGIFVLRGMRPTLGALKICCIVGIYLLLVFIVHLATTRNMFGDGVTFSQYVASCYDSDSTFGGVLYGVVVYPVRRLIGEVFSYILYAFFAIVLAFAWTDFSVFKGGRKKKKTTAVIRASEIAAGSFAPTRREPSFSRRGAAVGDSADITAGAHSLFVDEVHAVPRRAPRPAPVPKYTADGVPVGSNSAPRARAKRPPASPRGNAPVNPGAYMPDYIRDKYQPSSKPRSEKPVAAPEPPKPQILMPYVAGPAPQRVVHGAEEETVSLSRIINGESRSEELETQRRREEKIAEAEKRLLEEQRRATESAAPTVSVTVRPQSGIILGDEVSAQILAQKKARDEATARIKGETAPSYLNSASDAPEAGYMLPRIFNDTVNPQDSVPSEIRLPPPPKTFEQRAREELEESRRREEERKTRAEAEVAGVEAGEDRDRYRSSVSDERKPTDGLDFGRAFAGARHDEAGDLARAAHDDGGPNQTVAELNAEQTAEIPESNSVATSPFKSNVSFTDLFGGGSAAPVSSAYTFDVDRARRAAEEMESKRSDVLPEFGTSETIEESPAVLSPVLPIRVAEVDDNPEQKNGEQQTGFDLSDVEERPAPPPVKRERVQSTEFQRDLARRQLKLDDYRRQVAQDDLPSDDASKTLFPVSEKPYVFPPTTLLDDSSSHDSEITEECRQKAQTLVDTLKEFNVPCEVTDIIRGPSVTRYELQTADGIAVSKIAQRAADIAYSLATQSGVRIEAPIPGKRAVGVEVPNDTRGTVSLREVMESDEYVHAKSPLSFAVGTDIGGKKIVCDLTKMQHLLIAGATGMGKSSCLNSLIVSLISRVSPDDVRLIMIDPKMVEFQIYNGLPHLLTENVITEWENALNALDWLIKEYERRYYVFSSMQVRDLKEYRQHPDVLSGKLKKLPYIVLIVDEMADLIDNNKSEFEDKFRSIAQKARSAGIHLILATQRPSADIITGTIKANLPSRIAFKVASMIDSRVVLDQQGAENLCGPGDMLCLPTYQLAPTRVQGAFVTGGECAAVMRYVKENNESVYSEEVYNAIYPKKQEAAPADEPSGDSGNGTTQDALLLQVLWYFVDINMASTSRVQRRFRVGFNRAANIVDDLEYGQFVGPIGSGGSGKERAILITKEEFIDRFGEPTWL